MAWGGGWEGGWETPKKQTPERRNDRQNGLFTLVCLNLKVEFRFAGRYETLSSVMCDLDCTHDLHITCVNVRLKHSFMHEQEAQWLRHNDIHFA